MFGVDFVDLFSSHVFLDYISPFNIHCWRRKWQPTPVFLPRESCGWRAWWAAIYEVAWSRPRLKQLSSSSSNICCKAGLVVLNSLTFCLSEKLFISPSILNEILAGYSNLGCRFFLFNTLNVLCHSLLACRVSAERSAVKHKGFPLYVTCCFSLAAFNIFSLCYSLLV